MDAGTAVLIVLLLIAVGVLFGYAYFLRTKLAEVLQDKASRDRLARDPALMAWEQNWEPSLAARAAWKLAFSLVSKSIKQQKYLRFKGQEDESAIERFMARIVHDMVDRAIDSCDTHGGRLRHAGALGKALAKRSALRQLKRLADNRRTLRRQRRNGQLTATAEHTATSCGQIRSVREVAKAKEANSPPQPMTGAGPALPRGAVGPGQQEADRHLSLTSGARRAGEEGAPLLAVPGQLPAAEDDNEPLEFGNAKAARLAREAYIPRGVWALAEATGAGRPVGSLIVSFGDPQRGQLGLEPVAGARQVSRNTIITVEDLRGCEPAQVEAAGVASFVVGAHGQVWGFGSNRSMELGGRKEIAQVQAPQRVKSIRDYETVQLASSRSASGQAHTFMLDGKGQVYTFGSSMCGALGQGSDVKQTAPLLLRMTVQVPIRYVAVGARHSMLVSDEGRIFTVGDNRHGQLGHGFRDPANNWSPKFVDVPSPVPGEINSLKVKLIAAGDDHCLAVTEDGRLFAWGANSNGQLGVGRSDDQATPTEVRELRDAGIVSMAAGGRHSIVAARHGKQVWAFGSNVQGQLGLGQSSPSEGYQLTAPTVVAAISDQPNLEIIQVAAASCHSLAVMRTGEVYAWGDNTYGQLGFPREGAGHAINHSVLASVQKGQMTKPKQCRSRSALEVDAPRAFAEGVAKLFLPTRIVSLALYQVRSISTSDMHTLALTA